MAASDPAGVPTVKQQRSTASRSQQLVTGWRLRERARGGNAARGSRRRRSGPSRSGGEEIFAVGATCSHYGGPLAEGVLAGTSVRYPGHHACFSLRTGDVERTPALRPIPRWEVTRRGETIVVGKKIEPKDPELGGAPAPVARTATKLPGAIVIVGAGAAGSAAADQLRREGFNGSPSSSVRGVARADASGLSAR